MILLTMMSDLMGNGQEMVCLLGFSLTVTIYC